MQDLNSFAENELSTAEKDFVQAVLKGQRAELNGQRVRASVLRACDREPSGLGRAFRGDLRA